MTEGAAQIRVLIVDDEVELRKIVTSVFKQHFQCEVSQAENGLEALELAEKLKFDLIITDQRMPKMTGGQLIEQLRNSNGENKNVPIIMISGYQEEAQQAVSGWNDVWLFDKPIKRKILIGQSESILKSTRDSQAA